MCSQGNNLDINKQKVWKKCDIKHSDFLRFLSDLVHAACKGEAAIQSTVADRLKHIGLEVATIQYDPSELSVPQEFASPTHTHDCLHTSVVGKLRGNSDHPSLMLFAQGDTMPVNHSHDSDHNPLPTIRNGRLYGWGVSDNLAGVASMIFALENILAAGLRPNGDVILASTPSKNRTRGIISVLEHGSKTDAAIYVHPAENGFGLKQIKQATSGLLSFHISVPGRPPNTKEPGHTAFHHTSIDPIEKSIIIVQALQAFNASRGSQVHHPVLQEAIGRSSNLHIAHIQCGDANMLVRVSPECVLAGSITLVPGESVSVVQEALSHVVATASRSDEWLRDNPPTLSWVSGTQGAEVSIDHSLYKVAKLAISDVTGKEPYPNPLHTESDIRYPILYNNTPTIGIGPKCGGLTQIGGHDEWVNVAEALMTIKVLSAITMDWCGFQPLVN